ncbi:hypothetical protein HMPREF9120_01633 [Neisseria sp. oral taxon 020 str. F0370]|nr:hypothetical protein HMPREF9120_01633 [Neisseria sp. oral taxon 020 str. F0370]
MGRLKNRVSVKPEQAAEQACQSLFMHNFAPVCFRWKFSTPC